MVFRRNTEAIISAQPCYRNVDFKMHTCLVDQMKRFLMLIKSYVNRFDQRSIFITFFGTKIKNHVVSHSCYKSIRFELET